MAVPTSFDESTHALSKPSNLTDEQCGPLPILNCVQNGLPVVVSCWKFEKEELDEINKTGRVWLGVIGVTMPPVWIAGIKPFGEQK